ncbi:transcription initiation factor TFIID subunit 11-like [Dendronephthya gigantea]|uniref:transcription initiation factor TFIID subunit 11-like n=1 Tax=Dendronephthya gigantea TaxID=151771 RepID=UPI00106D16B3|nr:transcription initiation factor TFIID subunit 11-like [Dendronephthya gigantea]
MSSQQVMPLRHLLTPATTSNTASSGPTTATTAGPSTAESSTGDKATSDKTLKEEEEVERQKMQVLVSSFTEDQLNRYEMYRRSAFPKASVKKLMQSVTGGTSVPPNVVIAMAGIAKVYVGEICEEACDVAEQCNDPVPIQPKHIREAYRRLKQKGMVPNTKHKRKLFRK